MDIENCSSNECIKNVTAVKHNNQIELRWDWPDLDTGIDYVYIYEVKDELETLEELEKRNARHFSFSRKNYMENGCYRRTISSESVRYRIFPIKINHADTVVLNQTENTTKVLYKSIVIEYCTSIKLVGHRKKVNFIFSNRDSFANIPDVDIVYNKYDKDNRLICTYPLNIDLTVKEEYNIYIGKGEQVRLALRDKNSDIVRFCVNSSISKGRN